MDSKRCPHCGRFKSVSKEEMQAKINLLEKSNLLMEQELNHKREQLESLTKRNMSLRQEIFELKTRSLWDRILNR